MSASSSQRSSESPAAGGVRHAVHAPGRLLFVLLMALQGCAHLASVSVTSVPPTPGTEIKTVVESPLIVMGFRAEHEYVDEVVKDLKKQCSGGLITGILTKHEVIYWPLVRKHRITATGKCIR